MNEAVFVHGSLDVRVAPINLREGGPDETHIDVAAVGICGSDLHYYKDGGIGSAIIFEPVHSRSRVWRAPMRGRT
jgi:L-iditol 2-dehydrogenase